MNVHVFLRGGGFRVSVYEIFGKSAVHTFSAYAISSRMLVSHPPDDRI